MSRRRSRLSRTHLARRAADIGLRGPLLTSLRLEPLEERRMLAAMPELLKDMGVDEVSNPDEFTEVGDIIYFTASDGINGEQIWQTDGTVEGTLVVPSVAGFQSLRYLTNCNGVLYFYAFDDVHRGELWKSDGTQAGTVLVKDIVPGVGSSSPSRLINVGGTLFFCANDGTHGEELWRSDGTDAGTMLVKDINPGVVSSNLNHLVEMGGHLFFQATNNISGIELWKSDGTEAGTILLTDLQPGTMSTSPSGLTNVNGELFFSAYGGGSIGTELWTSDGTPAGTKLVKDIAAGSAHSYPNTLTRVGDKVLFAANDGAPGSKLWVSDGTAAGTKILLDTTGNGILTQQIFETIAVGELAYFYRTYSGTNELWRTDGTAIGTFRLISSTNGSFSRVLMSAGNQVYFTFRTAEFGVGLWKSDGTIAGTIHVQSVASSGPGIGLNDELIYRAQGELWKSDGTEAGTARLVNINVQKRNSSEAQAYVNVSGVTYFSAIDSLEGSGLWKTDGTESGTVFVKGFAQGPWGLTNVNGSLFFNANDGVHGKELWKSDGTTAGTLLVKDIHPGTGINYGPSEITNVNGTAFFTFPYNDSITGLWKTDGTEVGTVKLKEGFVRGLLDFNGTVVFVGEDGTWRSDGTSSGTLRLSTSQSQPANVNGTLYFDAYDALSGRELWKSDGTVAGTKLVKDIDPGVSSSFPRYLTNAGGTLFFAASTPGADREIWKSDGTELGTVLVKDINPGAHASSPSKFTTVAGRTYFAANDGVHGYELWTTDGMADGTYLVSDLRIGSPHSGIAGLTAVGEWLYFIANDGTHGSELWRVHSATQVPELLDIALGPASSSPSNLENVRGKLFFTANWRTGIDPWIIPDVEPTVAGRHLFYNSSTFDGQNAVINPADDGAIATDKAAYFSGAGLATSDNVSSYSRGINGIMIDIAGIAGELTAADFGFRVGTNNTPDSWIDAPRPSAFAVRRGAGVNGSDRLVFTWENGDVKNTWLQVVVRGNDARGGYNTNTGLGASDIFYWGNRIGDSGRDFNEGPLATTTADAARVYSALSAKTYVWNDYDYNRDGQVDSNDAAIVFANLGSLVRLNLSHEAASSPPIVASAEASRVAFALAITKELSVQQPDDEMVDLLARNGGLIRPQGRVFSRPFTA